METDDKKLLSEIYKYLLKKKVLILSITFVSMVLAFGYSFVAPHSYTSYATILPPLERSSGGGISALMSSVNKSLPIGIIGGGGNSATDYFLDILSSRHLAKKVSQDLNLYKDQFFEGADSMLVVEIVRSSIDAEFETSGILSISSRIYTDYFSSDSEKQHAKELSTSIVTSMVNKLDRFLVEREKNKASETRSYIEGELKRYNSKLDTLAILMEEFQVENKLLSIDDQTQATISQATVISSEIAVTQAELDLARLTFAEGSQQVKQLKSKLVSLENQYSEAQSGGVSNEDQFSLPLSKIPNIARRYALLYRDREVLEKVILFLETQKHQEAIQETKDVSQIEVLDEPFIPKIKTSPSRLLITIAFGIIVAFLTIVGMILNLVFMTRKNRSTSQSAL